MAGYLGTLFMANVGMRLLLPPKSEYNKAASGFGSMVQKVTSMAAMYGKKAGDNNVKSLRKALGKSSGLANQYANDNSKKNLNRLTKNLARIKSLTTSSIKGVGKAGAQVASQMPGQNATGAKQAAYMTKFGGHLGNISNNMDVASAAAARARWSFTRFADTIGGPLDRGLAQFRTTLGVTITMITSLGFAITGLTTEFSRFEKELINANSIWQESSETLFNISDRVIKFGENYGVAYSEASRVLYQFASAGLDAAESQAVLNDVLLLSMAVQGDANTIGKLTIQTIKGFGLEMSDAGVVTDKFAHSINASLIEYQDLASAIKFALPFYAATNQDLNQLLGSIQILTDRALEAGIAGRGLRQALAEFAQGAEDATRKFAKMGVEVTDQQGNFLQMTQIARNFANVIGGSVANDTELLTALIEDLNIRGATAFIHLVQNVDEFEEAVAELANSQGAANEMASIQQGSLVMQIQLLKNAAKEVFYLSDATYVAEGYLNEFDYRIKEIVKSFTQLFITEMPDGSKQLTDLSYNLRDVTTTTLAQFEIMISSLGVKLAQMTQNGMGLTDMTKALFLPLKVINGALEASGRILGAFSFGQMGSGVIGKYYFLSLVFGKMGATIMMAANAMQYLINTIAQGSNTIKDVLGMLMMIASVVPIGRGAVMAGKGGAAGMKAVSGVPYLKNPLGMQTRYKAGMKAEGGKRGGKGKFHNLKVTTNRGNPLVSQEDMMATEMAKLTGGGMGGRNFGMNAVQQKKHAERISLNKFNQQQQYKITTRSKRPWTRDARDFDKNFGVSEANWQLGQGGFLLGGGYQAMTGANVSGYSGQGWGYDPMMAQMGSSSNIGGSQDLYIANANIGSSNFQDLFYNSDQLGT